MSKTLLGSPPRMRGKVVGSEELPGVVGITPACAGKRTAEPQKPDANWDHPRVCGEKLGVGAARIGCGGITPACAGKRLSLFGKTYPEQDHPRVCGEKVTGIRSQTINEGSPPRMRGKVFEQVYTRIPFRITPACAGKRRTSGIPLIAIRDYPRVCGEKPDTVLQLPSHWGLPPRVRGKVLSAAGAGPCPLDYPRVCGEKRRH